MYEKLSPYDGQFSNDDRKQFVGEYLQQIRKMHKYSQKEVAGYIGISQATYSAYERGRNEPPAEILVRLSYLYSCTVDELVQRDRLRKVYREPEELLGDLQMQKNHMVEVMSKWSNGVSPELQHLSQQVDLLVKMLQENDAFKKG